MYKYLFVSENNSVFNWPFSQLLIEEPNCMKICFREYDREKMWLARHKKPITFSGKRLQFMSSFLSIPELAGKAEGYELTVTKHSGK